MSTLRRMTLILLPLGMPLVAMGEGDSSPLIEKVRQATAQYRDVQIAVSHSLAALAAMSARRVRSVPQKLEVTPCHAI